MKINGVRASDLMERGRNIELKPRKIHIGELKVIGEGEVTEGCSGKEFATFDLICECSKGTYIRALGRDIGRALGTYACVSQIRRHRIGNVTLDALRRRCSDPTGHPNTYVPHFDNNYSQMKFDNGNSHGKVFEEHDGYITIWDRISDTLQKYRDFFE